MANYRQIITEKEDKINFRDAAEILSADAGAKFKILYDYYKSTKFSEYLKFWDELHNNFTPESNYPKTTIVIGSDMAFCGNFNSLLGDPKIDVFLGKQMKKQSQHAIPLELFIKQSKQDDYLKSVLYFINTKIIPKIEKQGIKGIICINRNLYDEKKNKIKRSDLPLNLLPEKFEDIIDHKEKQIFDELLELNEVKTIIEPNYETVALKINRQFIRIFLMKAIIESQIAENKKRSDIMSQAVDSTNEEIKKLDLQAKKVRHAKITNELLEISAQYKKTKSAS